MKTNRYHFIFKNIENQKVKPILANVFFENNQIIDWHEVSFKDHFEHIEESHLNLCEQVETLSIAKSNLPILIDENKTLSFFHPHQEITFNERNESVFNYAKEIENSSLINIDLDEKTLSMLERVGADISTVEGVQKFYELLGDAFVDFIQNDPTISDNEKNDLINSIKQH